MSGSGRTALQNLQQYFYDRARSTLHHDVPQSPSVPWELEDRFTRVPQQFNGDDCGVFSIVLADYTAQRRAIDYTQFDMPFFRHSIALAICRQDL